MTHDPKVSIIYYSSTGSVHDLAKAVSLGAEEAGAETRIRQVPELAPAAAIVSNPSWFAHRKETRHIPGATLDDLRWADAVLFGTPARFGLPASQVKQFIDQAGGLWSDGVLENKVYASFTSTATPHGGAEATLLALNNTFYHWGGLIVPPGYTADEHHSAGNPYGASHVASDGDRPGDAQVLAAFHLGHRAALVARATQGLRGSLSEALVG